jgi:hypothetical protein
MTTILLIACCALCALFGTAMGWHLRAWCETEARIRSANHRLLAAIDAEAKREREQQTRPATIINHRSLGTIRYYKN